MAKAKTEAEKREARMMRAVMAYGRACEGRAYQAERATNAQDELRAAAKKDRALERVRDVYRILASEERVPARSRPDPYENWPRGWPTLEQEIGE